MKQSRFLQFVALALAVSLPVWGQSRINAGGAAGGAQVAIGFTGGSTWTSSTTGICIWYLPVIAGLDVTSLFVTDSSGNAIIDRAHSYFLWVSDFSVQPLTVPSPTSNFLALAPAGEGIIYYSSKPTARDFSDLTKRSTWGTPVATFIREASMVRSGDALASDTFIFSADLTISETISLNGIPFNFGNLIPHGMTCFEWGQASSAWEAGACVAIGKK
ncbi:MAG TPA: hypothetical protein VML19_15190 [Verrucomicrobiae bacterium]|nr:hypothetical protein [Verrucomicrobiae bacterium]